jgi:DNA-binding transcriptional MerR regulator
MAAGLTVGDFSRATHLSIKTLRHYHQVGLLEPTAVNPDTGYRYYSAGQIPTAQVIRRLRVAALVVPAAELAIISHHGSLADADLSYAKLGSYATTHEISIDGPLREYYLRGAGDTADEAEWRTEIGWPIFRADRPA